MRRTVRFVVKSLLPFAFALGGAAIAVVPPSTVPALREWSAGTGAGYAFAAGARIVAPLSLQDEAQILAADLLWVSGVRVPIASGSPSPGDIELALGDTDVALGSEGYRLLVGSTLKVSARSEAGVFAGATSLVQMLRQSRSLPAGVARDWPSLRERSVMIDVARKFYALDWLKARVRELAYLKYNTLHLHLSDDQAFRLESSGYPDIVATEHYSKAQMRDLLDYAARHHVEIVPEIDMPGHMSAILADRPTLALQRDDGNLSLNLAQAGSRDLARNLLEEYLPLFPGGRWHLGADEWLSNAELDQFPQLQSAAQAQFGAGADGRDLQYDFINWANGLVRAAGKTMRIWNDQLVPGTVVAVQSNVTVQHWYGADAPTPQQLADAGHLLSNANWQRLYAITDYGSYPSASQIYTSFQANAFALEPNSTQTIAAGDPALLGVQFGVWSDLDPDQHDAAEVAAGLYYPLRSLAQVSWGSPKPSAGYAGFKTIADRVAAAASGATSSMPGYGSSVPSNFADGTDASVFDTSRAAHVGDWVQLDLKWLKPLTRVHLRMTSPGSSRTDYIHQGVLEASTDGLLWQSLGTFAQAEIDVAVAVSARFLRFRATADQGDWVTVREFGAE